MQPRSLRLLRPETPSPAVLIIDQQEQIEITDRRRRAGAPDDRLAPFLAVRLPRRLDRRPDVGAAAGLAVGREQEVLAQQFGIGAPLVDYVSRVFRDLLARPAFRRVELDQLQDHVAAPSLAATSM